MSNILIAMSFNDGYIILALVFLYSLTKNLKNINDCEVAVYNSKNLPFCSISEENKQLINQNREKLYIESYDCQD